MALDCSDLQHRRAKVAAKKTKRRTAVADGTSPRRRRRKRMSDPSAAAFVVALLFSASVICLFLVVVCLLGSDDGAGGSSGGDGGRFLQVKKSGRSNGSTDDARAPFSAKDSAAYERAKAKKREERYESLYRPKFDRSTLGYDIYDCPFTPPKDYPRAWKTTEVLGSWNPNDATTLPPAHRNVYQGLCVFDHRTQYKAALNYRKSEKPFVIRNDPKVTSVAARWGDDPEYLHSVLGDVHEFRTERSPNNQFTWYRLRGEKSLPEGYERPPNDEVEMTFGEWLERALEKDGRALGDEGLIARSRALRERRLSLMRKDKEQGEEDDPLGDDKRGEDEDSEESKRRKYYYFRLNADLKRAREGSPHKFIYDELTFLDPRKRKHSEFYIVDPSEERGINCRFGMRGVTATNHFDNSRNFIAILGGERRYILGSPSQCAKMALFPRGHPSVRHSSLDWSNPAEWDDHPEFKEALVNEVVMRAGDALYLPTSWFHYIVNLSLNYQCNARSGISYEYAHYITDCGF